MKSSEGPNQPGVYEVTASLRLIPAVPRYKHTFPGVFSSCCKGMSPSTSLFLSVFAGIFTRFSWWTAFHHSSKLTHWYEVSESSFPPTLSVSPTLSAKWKLCDALLRGACYNHSNVGEGSFNRIGHPMTVRFVSLLVQAVEHFPKGCDQTWWRTMESMRPNFRGNINFTIHKLNIIQPNMVVIWKNNTGRIQIAVIGTIIFQSVIIQLLAI